jgi:hypothetical protein
LFEDIAQTDLVEEGQPRLGGGGLFGGVSSRGQRGRARHVFLA